MTDQQSIRDDIARIVQNETGEADEESQFVADAILASPVIRRIQAEALRDYASGRYEAFLNHPERDWTEQPPGLAQDYARAAQSLRTEADRIERGDR